MTEYEFFINAFVEFSKNKAIKKKVKYFYTNEITAWEKWLQLEFMYFLDEQKDIEIYVEDQFNRDKRSASKWINRVDLTYRRPKTSSDFYVGLELKINKFPECSIKQAIEDDLYGLSEILPNEWPFRAIISVAIYQRNARKKSKYIDLVGDIGTILKLGDFDVAVICWESEVLEKASRDSYKQWLKKKMPLTSSNNK